MREKLNGLIPADYQNEKGININNMNKNNMGDLIDDYMKIIPKQIKDAKNKKHPLSYFVVDFISKNTLYELKTLTKSAEQYVKNGYINLVDTKIEGNPVTMPIIAIDSNGNPYIFNIVKGGERYGINTLNDNTVDESGDPTSKYDYKVIFELKDGTYYYEPLKDPDLQLEEIKQGGYKGYYTMSLPYDKIRHSSTKSDYKIPMNKVHILKKSKHEQAHNTKTRFSRVIDV